MTLSSPFQCIPMRPWQSFLWVLFGASLCVAAPASAPQSTACSTIVNAIDQFIFNASLAYECLTSVPFNPAVATQFVQYYNDTLQFQSTLAYLKNPPPSYQQPAVDLMVGLEQLQQGINSGIFPNQYEFEAALQTLLYAAHDGHLELDAGILDAFSFASPYDIVSLSLDGIQLPKVYLAQDLISSNYFSDYMPSAILSINNIDAVTYLTEFAAKNSPGMLEAHADWNQLMLSAVQDILGYFNVFSGNAGFYPGDTITFKLENGTEIHDRFLAIYNSPGNTGPLETGGDFYNFFVLGFYPASYDPNLIDNNLINITDTSSTDPSVTSAALPTPTASTVEATSTTACQDSWQNPAYPSCPDVAQTDLGTFGGGFVSGYFLNDSSIAVLSIPSFYEYGVALNTFNSAITEFITRSKAAGLKKVVIDVQSNTGGLSLLAIGAFRLFFPDIDPFAGSRMRAHHAADIMGQTLTSYYDALNLTDDDFFTLAADEWVATTRINADTNRTFASWAEFFGPHAYDGDEFTTTQRYNLSNTVFDQAAVGDPDGEFTLPSSDPNTAPLYNAEDIVILSDGICDSACALFMEMMHHEAGVRVVVAGGRISTGPMQAPSGSRGARVYSTDLLDANIYFAQILLENQGSPDANFLPNRTEELDVFVTFASVNLRDQVRRGETMPLQFAYEAADCRIFYTPQTVYNYTALWRYAADAIWTNSSLCVAGSTGFATSPTTKTDFVGPPVSSNPKPASATNITSHLTAQNMSLAYLDGGIEDSFTPRTIVSKQTTLCKTNAECAPKGLLCEPVTVCEANGKLSVQKQCVQKCFQGRSRCAPNGALCELRNALHVKVGGQTLLQGFCQPPVQCAVGLKGKTILNVDS